MNAKSLKYPAAFLCLASLALATGCARQKPTTSHPHTPAPNGPGSTSHPPTVFQKAFWKHPAADDRFLHAERREWTNATGEVDRWDWFLIMEPSPATRAWVLSNPFLLATASSLPAGSSRPADDQPAWFPEPIPGGHCFASPARNLRISLSHDGKILHATDSGGGLASAIPSSQDR
jgi:hypothetical protein